MNPEAQVVLDEILKLDPEALSKEQRAFLRARRSYLKESQLKEYASVLQDKVSPKTEVKKEELEEEGQGSPSEEQDSYEALLKRANELGYTGKRIKRDELEAFIASNQPKQ